MAAVRDFTPTVLNARLVLVMRALPREARLAMEIVHAEDPTAVGGSADLAAAVRRLLEWDAAFWHLQPPPASSPSRAAAAADAAAALRHAGEYERMLEAVTRCLLSVLKAYAGAHPDRHRTTIAVAQALLLYHGTIDAAGPTPAPTVVKGWGDRRRGKAPRRRRRCNSTSTVSRTDAGAPPPPAAPAVATPSVLSAADREKCVACAVRMLLRASEYGAAPPPPGPRLGKTAAVGVNKDKA